MNFQIPQFIEVEDKIFGPLSFRQFLYIAGGTGFGYLFYKLEAVPLVIRIIPAALCLILGLTLAFYRVNNRPFIYTVQAAVEYFLNRRLYLWKKDQISQAPKDIPQARAVQPATMPVSKVSESKLKDLTWSLDIKEKIQ